MKYINNPSLVNIESLNSYLLSLIFSEKPYLAENIKGEDKSTITLLDFCKFFNEVLKDNNPTDLIEFDLDFEEKYHSLIGLYLSTLHHLSNNSLECEES